jgi:riboflavin synthase alpha subunit
MRTLLGLVIAGSLALSGVAFGQSISMTGKVLSVTSSTITMQSGSDVWQIARNSTTKVTGDLKVGATVTINCNAPDAQKKEGPAG